MTVPGSDWISRGVLPIAYSVLFVCWGNPAMAAIPNGGFEVNTVNTGGSGFLATWLTDG